MISLITANTTQAQEESRGPVLEEVIVTAQKRSQNLQEVPVSVTALSGDMLEQSGITNIAEVERVSPNTTLRPSRATNTTLTAYIRGIGQNDPLWGFEPGVGMYIDDIYIARPQGAMVDLYDLERIEVLRGPQGTLYGKNTIGGAIKYVTKKMSGEAEGKVKVGLGSYNQRDLVVSGQLPIVADSLYIGAAIASFNRDGFGENKFDGKDNYNKDVFAGRVSLEWTPVESLFLRLAADNAEDNSNAKQGTRLVTSLNTGEDPHDPFDSNSGLNYDSEVKNSGQSLTVDWSITDSISLKSITAFREGSTDSPIDFDGTPRNAFDAPVRYEDDQTTQELQLTYTGDRVKFVGGLYYYSGNAEGAFDVIAGRFDLGDLDFTAPGEVPGEEALPTFTAATAGSAETSSQAVYFHSTFDVTNSVSFTLGARYTQDEKSADVYKANLLTIGGSSEFDGEDVATLEVKSDFEDEDSWNQLSPKLGVDWKFSDASMLYYSYSEGFKSGGINMRADVAGSPTGFSQVFDPEEAKAHEIGIKTELLDGRMRVNAAYFKTDYTSVQQTTNRLIGTAFIPFVITDNEQEIQGIELEASTQLTNQLNMVFNVGWLDAEWTKFTDFDNAGNPFDASDIYVVSNTPEFSGLLGFNYDLDLAETGSIVVGVNVSYTDEIAPEIIEEAPINADTYTLYGASVSWYSADEKWNVALHGKNLTDEKYLVAGYNFPSFLGEDSITGFYGDPRTITLNASYQF
ncbi:MAG: TonB-dependent receptor [Agarilytica sp.]